MKCHTECRLFGIPLSWMALIVFDAGLVVIVMGQDRLPEVPTATNDLPTAATQLDGNDEAGPNSVRFAAIDVFVDSGDKPLAAYQFELQSHMPGIEIVGIEGGEHAAYSEPPYYDPRAMNNNRVILAAFSTADDLPSGRSRIARVHVQVQGSEAQEFESRLDVCATTDGESIPATMTLTKATLTKATL